MRNQIARPPSFVRKLYPLCTWRMPAFQKKIYLTFDDGPVTEVTPMVLDILQRTQTKATFFCVGDNVKKNPEIYKRIQSEGHALGNHTFNHLKGFYSQNSFYFDNVEKCAELVKSNLFRPPYGQISFTQQKHLSKKYKIILWDVLSFDYSQSVSPEKCLKNVVDNARNGSIIVFHDSIKAEKNLKFALPRTIEILKDKGYSFDIIS